MTDTPDFEMPEETPDAITISALLEQEWASRPNLHTLPFVGLEDILGGPISNHRTYRTTNLGRDARDWDVALGIFARKIGNTHVARIQIIADWGDTPTTVAKMTAAVEPSRTVLIQWIWGGDSNVHLHCIDPSDAVLVKLLSGDPNGE